MALTPTTDYVKFVRGSKTAFAALTNKSNDTLYFIYDDADSSNGLLYLGARLIGGTGDGSATSLSELTDIAISAIGDKQLLVYNETSKKWENGSIADLLAADEKSITKAEIGTLSLKGFEVAAVGTLASKGEDGNLSWLTPVETVKLLNIYSKSEIDEKFDQSLSRKVVESTDAIDLTAADAENYIYLVKNSEGTYDEYIVADGKLEKVGDWKTDLSGYATKKDLESYIKTAEIGTLVTDNVNTVLSTKVGDLSNYGGDNPTLVAVIGNLSSYNAANTLVDKIEEIDSRLTWSALS